jgi:hypothetical protein
MPFAQRNPIGIATALNGVLRESVGKHFLYGSRFISLLLGIHLLLSLRYTAHT